MLNRREVLKATAAATCATLVGASGAGAGAGAAGDAQAGTVASTSPGSRRATATAPSAQPWFRKSPRVFLLDFQMPDPLDQSVPGMPSKFFENLSPEKIVDQLAAAHVNTLLVHAKDNQGNAYYDSKAAHKHSQIGDRDLMAEFSKLCRAKK